MQGKQDDPRWSKRCRDKTDLVITNVTGDLISDPLPAGRFGNLPTASLTFQSIRKQYIDTGKLWEDTEFPADDSSLYINPSKKPTGSPQSIEWKRPKEIMPHPQFIMDGISRFDVKQTKGGDCWFLASIASLAVRTDLIEKIVPKDQGFSNNYCGVFHFNFWLEGKWREVMVDDRLPTVNNRLVYVSCGNPSEFWAALLEKAYAKLKGSYEAMKSGYTRESLTNLSGGICETFNLREKAPEDLAEVLKRAVESKSVMTCSIGKFPGTEDDIVKGLMASQAYSVTGFAKDLATNKESTVSLIRVRNPWGDSNEWNGPWKDNGPEWNTLTETQKRELGYEFKEDGEFWMDLKDFVKYFENLYVCHLDFKSLALELPKTQTCSPWNVISIHDSWRPRINAGGSQRYINTYCMNPQYKISIKANTKSNVIVGLLLKEIRKKALLNSEISTCGYDIWKIVKPELPNGKTFFQGQEKVFSSSFDAKKQNQYSSRLVLSSGEYLIIPFTSEPDQECDFLLRILLEDNEAGIVEKFEDNNRIIEVPASERPAPLTQEQKEDLRLLHKLVSGVSNGLFAEDLLRILNEGLKTDFTQTQMTLRVGTFKQKDHLTPEKSTAVANGHVVAQASPPRARSSSKKGGFLTSCMGGVKNAKEEAVKLLPKKTKAITLETARSLITCIDSDREGCLDLDEFLELWELLRLWRSSFLTHDVDKSSTIDSFEMKHALKGAGFELDDNVYQTIICRFADKRGDIHFDEFLLSCSRLKTSMDIFEETKSKNNSVQFSESQYLTTVMYL